MIRSWRADSRRRTNHWSATSNGSANSVGCAILRFAQLGVGQEEHSKPKEEPMRAVLSIVAAIMVVTSFANAADYVHELTRQEFEELQVSERGITLNNFTLGEETSFMAKGVAKVRVSFSVRNRNNDTRKLTVMIVGMSDNDILWAVDAGPMMAMVSANKVEECNGTAYVPPGTVKQTKRIWMRIVGEF
jgi:hypothetical protein